jgi:hypothetical protein
MTYLTIPSDSAINKKQAVKKFFDRYEHLLDQHGGIDWEKMEDGVEGINYQGDHGETVYLKFHDFYK